MSYVLEYLAAFAVVAAAFWLPGYVIERSLSPLRDPGGLQRRDLRRLARFCLGLGFWMACTFALCAVGQLHQLSLWSLISALLVAALWAHRRFYGPPAERRKWSPPDSTQLLLVAAPALVLAPLCLLTMSPLVSWDAATYHLTLPKLFIDHRGFRPVEFNVYSNWPLNTELLFAIAMLIKDYVAAKLVHFGFGLLTLYAVYVGCHTSHRPGSAGRTGGRRSCGGLAMALFLANGIVASEIHVAFVDLAHAFFFITAFLFMTQGLDDSPRGARSLLLAGICCGLMAGLKVQGITGAAIIGTLCLPRLVESVRTGELLPVLRRILTHFALPVLVLWIPWLVKAACYTGNPVYPLLYGYFGGPDWSSALTDQFQAWQSGIGMGRAPLDYLLLPLRVILFGGPEYSRFGGEIGAFWIALLPVTLWIARRHQLVRRCLWVAGLHFVFWSLSSQQIRFLIPILPLLAIASALSVFELLDRLPSAEWRRTGRRLAWLAGWALVVWIHLPYLIGGPQALVGYLRAEGGPKQAVVLPVYRFINQHLPPDARLLFLNTNQGFFCDREYIADSFFEASQIADWLAPATGVADLRRRLADRGITHLLVEQPRWSIAYPQALLDMLRDPRQIELLYRSTDARFSVLALRQAAPSVESNGGRPRRRP
jgi:hypothetical protein